MQSADIYRKRLTVLARIDFAAPGLVCLMVGCFAIDAALYGGEPSDNQGVLGSLADSGMDGSCSFSARSAWPATPCGVSRKRHSIPNIGTAS